MPSRRTSWTRTAPTRVGLPAWPHGPAPRSAAASRRMRPAGTAARPAASTLHGEISRSAHDSTAGRSTSASTQPSSCSHRARRDRPSRASVRTPVRNGRSRSSASSGGTWPVSASTEWRPDRIRSKGPVRRSAAASARAVARVSEPAKAGSVMMTPSVSAPRSSPQAIASRSESSALGGPSVMTVTVDEGSGPAASSTAWDTARRQYGFSSSGRPVRMSRPSSSRAISVNVGTCLTTTAIRISARRAGLRGPGGRRSPRRDGRGAVRGPRPRSRPAWRGPDAPTGSGRRSRRPAGRRPRRSAPPGR